MLILSYKMWYKCLIFRNLHVKTNNWLCIQYKYPCIMIYIEIDYRIYAAVIVITIKEINSSVNDQSFHFVLTLRFMKSHSSSISILLCK